MRKGHLRLADITAPYGSADSGRSAFAAAEFQHTPVSSPTCSKRPPQTAFRRDFPLAWDNVLYESPSRVMSPHTPKRHRLRPNVAYLLLPMCAEKTAGRHFLTTSGAIWPTFADRYGPRAPGYLANGAHRHHALGHAMVSPRPDFIWSGYGKGCAAFEIFISRTTTLGVRFSRKRFIRTAGSARGDLTAETRRKNTGMEGIRGLRSIKDAQLRTNTIRIRNRFIPSIPSIPVKIGR